MSGDPSGGRGRQPTWPAADVERRAAGPGEGRPYGHTGKRASRPSGICAAVGVGVATVGSFLIALILGTGYGFGLFLHLVLIGIVGWLLAMKCSEEGDELWGLVGLIRTARAKGADGAGAGIADRLAETAKAGAGRVAEAARRLPERAADATGRSAPGSSAGGAPATPAETPAKPAGEGRPYTPAPDSPAPDAPAPDSPAPDAAVTDAGAPRAEPSSAAADPVADPAARPAISPKATPPAMDAVAGQADAEAKPSEAAPAPEGTMPPLLDAPRGEADDLTRISGIGPKLAAMLNELGVWHHAQIATWTEDEVAWIDEHIDSFRGRARGDDWVGQARALVAGGEAAVAAARPAPGAGADA